MINFNIEKNDVYAKLTLLNDKLGAKHSYKLKEIFYSIINQNNAKNVIVDLKKVQYIDSSIISAFMLAKRLLEERGTGNIYLINVNEPVLKILKLVYIDKQIPILNSEKEVRELIFINELKEDIDIDAQKEIKKIKQMSTSEEEIEDISELLENWDEEDLITAEFEETMDQIEDLINFLQEHLKEIETQYQEDEDILKEIVEIDDDIIEEF